MDANNVYRAPAVPNLPIRRVVVLPLVASSPDEWAGQGSESLEDSLFAELTKAERMEVLTVQPAQLKEWSGKAYWTAEEPLPQSLLLRLREQFDCDAVLFSKLTSYRPFPPIQVGWNLKLVDIRTGEIRWAVDEVFNAGQPRVASAARDYADRYFRTGQPLEDTRQILLSPRRFGQFAASVLFSTLPPAGEI